MQSVIYDHLFYSGCRIQCELTFCHGHQRDADMSSKRGMTGDELSAIYRNIDRASRDHPRPVPPVPVPVTPSAPPASGNTLNLTLTKLNYILNHGLMESKGLFIFKSSSTVINVLASSFQFI